MRKTALSSCCAVLSMIAAGAFLFSVGPSEAAVTGVRISSSSSAQHRPIAVQSGFEVDLLVNGRSLEEYHARGNSYVEAIAGAEYEVRVRNPLPYRVAVALSVDGLNSIDARRTSAWNASKWVIEPYGTIQIGGWQMSSDRARRFYFTTERDSYGAKLGQTTNLGLISAVFFRERRPIPIPIAPPPRPHPRYEEDGARSRKSSEAPSASGQAQGEARGRSDSIVPRPNDDYAATGIGRSVRNDVRWINLELDSRPAAQVKLRYEYYPALVRLGVLPRHYERTDSLRRREAAQGFEDRRFSPEP